MINLMHCIFMYRIKSASWHFYKSQIYDPEFFCFKEIKVQGWFYFESIFFSLRFFSRHALIVTQPWLYRWGDEKECWFYNVKDIDNTCNKYPNRIFALVLLKTIFRCTCLVYFICLFLGTIFHLVSGKKCISSDFDGTPEMIYNKNQKFLALWS